TEDRVELGGFQTICVDEAQDVAQTKFDALLKMAAEHAEWFLSDSPEQAIYDQRSSFMMEAVEIARRNGTWEPKRVNLRSGVAQRLVADAALEISPDVSQIEEWVHLHPIRTTSSADEEAQGALDLDLEPEELGTLPDLLWLP